MKNKMQKYTAAMLGAMMMLSAVPVSAAQDSQNIVILGDSFAAGTALQKTDKSYVEMLEDCANVNVQNFSKAGSTTQDVLSRMEQSDVTAALKNADVIVVNVGIHDIMDPFMAKANQYMDQWGFERFTDVFFANLADYNLDEMDLMIYNAELVNAAETNKETAAANMAAIAEELRAYADARVILQNAYNPIDTVENLADLSDKRQKAYNSICDVVSKALNESVNATMTQAAAANGYEVFDVFSMFKGYAYKYVNLSDLDMSATVEGHKLVGNALTAKLGLVTRGDVNMDGEVDATDAAAVLIHAASTGSGGTGTLSGNELVAADVTEDGEADSVDAARILVYSAALGADGKPSWE
jgi:lysophospholipase L1-like esterase